MASSKSCDNSSSEGGNMGSANDSNGSKDGKTADTEFASSKKELILKSPMGGNPATYTWPLKKGRGSVRRSEDKQDEAAEISETIR